MNNHNDWMQGVDLPNKMTPGAWIIVCVVLAMIIGGFVYMLIRFRSKK